MFRSIVFTENVGVRGGQGRGNRMTGKLQSLFDVAARWFAGSGKSGDASGWKRTDVVDSGSFCPQFDSQMSPVDHQKVLQTSTNKELTELVYKPS